MDKSVDKWVFPKLANLQTLGITSIGQIAQLVEQRTENPCVGGSIPPLATALYSIISVTNSKLLLTLKVSKILPIIANIPQKGV